jgi:hypothetical protein
VSGHEAGGGGRRMRPLRHALRAPGWLGRNRWGLVTLPLAAVAALVASSDRVALYFWDQEPRLARTAQQGQWVDFRDPYTDSDGEHLREVRVRLDAVAPASQPWESTGSMDLPPGSKALSVQLSMAAAPEVPLSVCKLVLRDADGTRYEYLPAYAGMTQPVSPCVPPTAPGPFPALGELDEGRSPSEEPARPATWQVAPVIVVPADATITEVNLWWELPDYVAMKVAGG